MLYFSFCVALFAFKSLMRSIGLKLLLLSYNAVLQTNYSAFF